MDKTVAFDNPDGGMVTFNVTNVLGTSCYGGNVDIAFHPGSPASAKYGECLQLYFGDHLIARDNLSLIRNLIGNKKEEVDIYNEKKNVPPAIRQNFKQSSATLGQTIDRTVEAVTSWIRLKWPRL